MSDTIDPAELREAVRPVLTDHRGDVWPVPGEEGRAFNAHLWRQCAELGWMQLAIPEDQDGLGLGLQHLAIVYEEMGRALASAPFLPTMLAVDAIAGRVPAAEQGRLFEAISAGECRAAIGLAQTHSHLIHDAAGTLSGTVANVLFGDVADILLLPVRASGPPALAIIPAGAPGVQRTKRALADLTRSAADVTLDAVELGECVLAEMDQAAWDGLLDHAAVGMACDSVGAADAVFGLTLEYLNTREQFGRLIGSFQALKHRAADWKCRLETAAALARHCAVLVSGGDAEASATASGAKAYSCDMFAGLAGDAIQLHGGIGFTWEHPCHLFLKRAKLSQQLFGKSIYHKERVARLAFGDAEPGSVERDRAQPPTLTR